MNKDSYHSMKRGLALSLAVHVIFLSWGAVHFTTPVSLPKPLEAISITLAPLDEKLSYQQGALDAPVRAIPAVKPTTKPQEQEEAHYVGEGKIDNLAPFKPKEKPRDVKATPPPPSEAEMVAEKPVPRLKTQELLEEKTEEMPEISLQETLALLQKEKFTLPQEAPKVEQDRHEEALLQEAPKVEQDRHEQALPQEAPKVEQDRHEQALPQEAPKVEQDRHEQALPQEAPKVEQDRQEQALPQEAPKVEQDRHEQALLQEAPKVEQDRHEQALPQEAPKVEQDRHEQALLQEAPKVEQDRHEQALLQEAPKVEQDRQEQALLQEAPKVEKEHRNKEMSALREVLPMAEKMPIEPVPLPQQEPQIVLPENSPFPQFKPKFAKKTVTQKAQALHQKKQQTTEQTIEDILAMEEQNLLNRARTQGGGAKRSQKPEALGARKNMDDTAKMAQTLVNIAGGCIQQKLKLVALGGDLKNRPILRLRFYLNREGRVVGDPIIDPLSGAESQQAIMIRQVYAAVFACQPYQDLPRDQYDLWGQGFDFNVDPLQNVIE
ncbi:cell envelope biogenesis protein TolA [Bartonella raoultii]|uniref:Cell envelope biogenesis protein TolA n=1 Tax=Bartonella raoultii TaxID=1457020 RepID=A0ABS7I5Z2_9HYPH|nr:cell envelope biogenesis protein TolA [Bartonella raoultii]MBX4335830.1 cell envelope biogenesis protein TolA [Bartonella raoultii]